MSPATVAVMGSCATRDNFNEWFNPGNKRFYTCPLHQNQTSIIALMSPPMEVDWSPTGEMSDYNRWNVQTEFDRSFLTAVTELQPTYLILDSFADVHFGCLRLADGNHVTDNRWKIRKTDWFERLEAEQAFDQLTVFNDTEAYLELWKAHYHRFDAFVRESLPNTTVVVHRRVNAELLRPRNRRRPVSLQKHGKVARMDIALANQLARELDDFAITTSGAEVIDLTGTRWVTYKDHPWGAAYGHYEAPYYHRFLAQLHEIHLRRTFGDDIALMVRQVDEARREEAESLVLDRDDELAQIRRRLRAGARRIAELESASAKRFPRFGRRRQRGRSRSRAPRGAPGESPSRDTSAATNWSPGVGPGMP